MCHSHTPARLLLLLNTTISVNSLRPLPLGVVLGESYYFVLRIIDILRFSAPKTGMFKVQWGDPYPYVPFE